MLYNYSYTSITHYCLFSKRFCVIKFIFCCKKCHRRMRRNVSFADRLRYLIRSAYAVPCRKTAFKRGFLTAIGNYVSVFRHDAFNQIGRRHTIFKHKHTVYRDNVAVSVSNRIHLYVPAYLDRRQIAFVQSAYVRFSASELKNSTSCSNFSLSATIANVLPLYKKPSHVAQ